MSFRDAEILQRAGKARTVSTTSGLPLLCDRATGVLEQTCVRHYAPVLTHRLMPRDYTFRGDV